MANSSEAESELTIQEHLQRAEELGVTVEEYCEAYQVDKKSLVDGVAILKKQGRIDLSVKDFVKVDITDVRNSTRVVCSINDPSGRTLQCHEWPPADWLQSLGSVKE